VSKHKRSGRRESETTGQSDVTDPLGRDNHGTAIKASAIKRLNGENGIFYPQLIQPEQWLIDETTGSIVLIGGVKRRQG
jgi:hypothetical protein